KVADVEGYPEVAGLFKDTADGETGHAHGHLDFLKSVGDPATGLPIGNTAKNLKAAVAGETHEYETMYPGMAKTAREEGFEEAAGREGLEGDRGVVRDARKGREAPRRPFPKAPRPPRLNDRKRGTGRPAIGRPAPARTAMSQLPRRPPKPPAESPDDPRYWSP